MRLHVRHQTAYHYSRPIAYAIQTLRLTPSPYDGLAVLSWRIAGETRHPLPAFTDGFGNLTHCHSVNRIHTSAAVYVEGEVETRETGGVVNGAAELLPAIFYLRATPLTAPSPAIWDLARDGAGGDTALARLTALMNAIHDRVTYKGGVTHAGTTADESLTLGAGVCQDHAHIFAAAARALGFPARYAGGYLWTGADDFQASHAWAEALVPDMGWVGFDPSNRTLAGETHIRTAIGLDYWSAAPIRGVRRGDAEEELAVKVQVTRSDGGGAQQ